MFSPQVKEWIQADPLRRRFFLPRSAFVFAFILLVTMGWIPILRPNEISSNVWALWAALLFVVQMHHNYSQTLGLSLAYGSKFRIQGAIDDVESAKMRKLETAERWLCRCMMGLNYFSILLFLVETNLPHQKEFQLQLSCVSFAFAVSLVILGLSYPKRLRNKKWFMVRYLVYPLIPYSLAAKVAWSASHGVEYAGVFYQMQAATIDTDVKVRRRIVLGSLAVISLYLLASFMTRGFHGFFKALSEDTQSRAFFMAVITALGFWHYHVDTYLFRMKDFSTRKHIGPLLLRQKAS